MHLYKLSCTFESIYYLLESDNDSAGLYDCAGHVVPYLVLVKIGKPAERTRLGNRGKRDSQMLLMHFLNNVRVSYPFFSFTNLFYRFTSIRQ
jgi:hypothetical protein